MCELSGETMAFRALRIVIIGIFLFGVAVVLRPSTGSAHIPITTKIMFDKEVIRILQRNCLNCHHPSGSAFSLASYKDARPWAKAIEVELLDRRMPPWRPIKGFGDFANSPKITQQDIDLIVNWVENGVPEGDPKDFPTAPLFSDLWQLGQPDLVLKTGESPTVKPDADEYKTFTLATGLSEDRWISAIDLRPGNGPLVHCATFYLERPTDAAHDQAADSREGPRLESLGSWMPGQKVPRLEQIGRRLPVGSHIVVKIHYHGGGDDPGTDSSEIGLYLTNSPPAQELIEAAIDPKDQLIPVSSTPHRLVESYIVPGSAQLIGIRPSSNALIVSLEAAAYRPDGTEEILLWVTGYGPDWQPAYYLRRPETLPKGTRIEVTAYFDNSDANRHNPNYPAKAVKWSEASSDPLCSLLLARPESNPY
jgi:hypothetical protein